MPLLAPANPKSSNTKAEVIWEAQPGAQTLFLGAIEVFEVLIEGTRGGGKTDCMLMAFASQVGRGFGSSWRGIIFRRTYPELKDIMEKSKKWFYKIFPGITYNESNREWRWKTGELLLFRHMASQDDYWNYHGHEYPFIGWEELTNWPNDICYRRMMSCCRSSTPGMPRMVRATTNPYGPGHHWVKRRFKLPSHRYVLWEPEPEAKAEDIALPEGIVLDTTPKKRLAIFSSVYENRKLLEADPGYILTIKASASNPQEEKAWLEGSWDVVSGGMFSDIWDAAVHVVPMFQIPFSWRISRTLDWGSAKPFAYDLWAESDGTPYQCPITGKLYGTVRGDLFNIAEDYGCDPNKDDTGLYLTSEQQAQRWVEFDKKWREKLGFRQRIRPGAGDHNIFAKDRGPMIHTTYLAHGIHFIPAVKGPNSRKDGWRAVRDMLQQALPPEGGGPREKPGLFFMGHCATAIDFMGSVPRSDKDPDDIPDEFEDHKLDGVRYKVRERFNRAKQRSF